ncbi:TetR/AcrR family transcriptional regulator [Pseudomonas sp. LD120]|uniref:TetR/AcrR family transcriptional regulator n=1 Tax=Pseudomonas sp. LD120 TaxID=485751 RepID=UPI001358A6BA|nr:TetR/AcrR family transcriptional regulator [Pseudomonas sp. LD120]KAF0864142.1 TetR family transcriptional regulator [Pseudomonas sp. LD120]
MAERCSRFAESRDKALELFASKGFGQVGMRELASHLGLTPGSLYHHYPSKQHLLLDLIEEFFDELHSTLKRLQRRKLQGDCLPALIRAHLKLHRELPRHFRLVERDSGCLNPDQQLRVGQLRERYEQQLLQLLGPPPGQGEAARRATAHAVASLLNNAPSWFSEQPLAERERDALLENLLSGAIERLLGGASPQSAVA